MLLTIDIGNTNITLGAYDGDSLLFTARLATQTQNTDDQYAVAIKNLLSLYCVDVEEIEDAINNIKEKLGDNGRILLRKSGTEPVIRVMAEAEKEEICNKFVDEIVDLIVKKGYTN